MPLPRESGDSGISRRTLLKAGVAVGATAVAGLGGYAVGSRLLVQPSGRVLDTFLYAQVPQPEDEPEPWWTREGLVGKEVRVGHFPSGQAANALWRVALDRAGEPIRGTGLPALLVRVEDPSPLAFPPGYDREEFVVDGMYAVFNLCPHAGCRPAWKLRPVRILQDPTGPQEPICCACHYAQFHPREFAEYRHPDLPDSTEATYVGVRHLGGPVDRGMPLIPLEIRDDVLVGRLRYPAWYQYLDYRHGVPE